jgi:hypothetical protein
VAVLVLVTPLTVHAGPGDVTIPFLIGPPVWAYTYAQNGQPAKTMTVSDRFSLVESIGVTYGINTVVRVGLSMQFTEALTHPPPASAFTNFALTPTVAFQFWGPLSFAVGPTFQFRRAGVSDFGVALSSNLQASFPIGGGVSIAIGVAVQNLVTPVFTTTVIPYTGLSFKVVDGSSR